ncbi:hypothetical protein BJ322DRAFT_1178609 [Thelephora terrestris]|uniref:Protein kinase domain-containing protein n=1 Tax=Thelephora terrestris TaxID=56493 RepID=A0A9P6HL46_9AGAM|nr:hypothetical protein BJ322DRAFT_1178609 [Thelephora terrestris]
MSTTPPRSVAQSNHLPFRTLKPKRDPSVTCYDNVSSNTPSNCGTSARERQKGDTDRVEGYKCDDYDDYIHEDLKSRVFVDFEIFLQSALHVPRDWKTLWGPAIEAVKANEEFSKSYGEYCEQCQAPGFTEKPFYKPLMDTAHAVLDVVSASEFDGISGTPQYYQVSDRIINRADISPDLVVLHKNFQATKDSQTSGELQPPKEFHWANALHVLEVKSHHTAICDGDHIPRLIIDEIDPLSKHAPQSPHKFVVPTTPTTGSDSTSSKKRRSGESHTSHQQTSKKARTQSNLPPISEDDPGSSVSTPEPQTQASPAVQIGSYLLEMFSVPLLRSHATVCLVDRDRLQLYHANRSVILVSSAINISTAPGLDQFIAVIIAFHCLSLDQNGILHTFAEGNAELVKDTNISSDDRAIQNQNELQIKVKEPKKGFTLTLGDVISREPAIIGRSTVVLRATSEKWPGEKLVVKVSWPSYTRDSENEFVNKAIEEAKKEESTWAAKHLPKIWWAGDINFGTDSTFESVANLFEDATFAADGKFVYERRALRIIVQEELHPLKSLGNVKEIGQVFVDVACVHRWLHDHPGILHRDPSPNNIMCRISEEPDAEGKPSRRVYGVLTDYDLSSWTKDLKKDYSKTSQQRTGTPPYMAHELLTGASATHLYRHDLESLFYVMLLTCGRHKLANEKGSTTGPLQMVMRGGCRPYQGWFNQQDYDLLGDQKWTFFTLPKPIELSPCFKDFRAWLRSLQSRFKRGFSLKSTHMDELEEQQGLGGSAAEIAPFDDETLAGHIDYSSFIEPVRRLSGELEGLIIRYDSKAIPLPLTTPTCVPAC